jgi:hypothetical protein
MASCKEKAAELRHNVVSMHGELQDELASVKPDVVVLTKTVKHL